ncbi:MAG: MotA/TolQ/ExbB proton channel family protein [Verrucomicrobia bacterium]|nr:MotA/TolQ/ExbB proton channel family protein [Verrucomicrobiota bacterium]MDA1066004.1 MotA/TolQ/ExbB proton channel family protein [Verrucomicrobiota bacterium]
MRSLIPCFILFIVSSAFSGAETLEEALAWSREELTAVRKELSEQRDKIVDEKLPIARELREIREKLVEEQKNKRFLDAQQEGGNFELDQLKSRQSTSKELAGYLGSQAIRFRQNFESDLVVGERYSYVDTLLSTGAQAGTSPIKHAEAQWEVIEASLNRLDRLPGGTKFETEAVSDTGVLVGGSAIQFGPLVFFKGANDNVVGNLAASESLQPQIRSLDDNHKAAVRGLFAGNEVLIPVDPTLGQAALIQQESVSFMEHLALGGFWMIPICLFGLLAFLTSIFKWISIQRVRLPSILEFEELRNLSPDKLNNEYKSDSRRLVASLIAVKDVSPDIQSAELDVAYQEFKFNMNRWLPIIALTAGVSPLLGLLGTVTGMIKTFQLISLFGAGDAKLLSSGISEALITTEFGLVVAIPALVLHAFLQRRVKKILVGSATLMEQVSRGVEW